MNDELPKEFLIKKRKRKKNCLKNYKKIQNSIYKEIKTQ